MKPTINVGPAIQQSKAPGWLKRLFGWLKGLVIHAGPVDIQLSQGQGATPPRTGLDKPHRITPPKTWGPFCLLSLALALPSCGGITLPDSDGDGIPDLIDPCPEVPDPTCVPAQPPPESYDCAHPPTLTGLVLVKGALKDRYIVVSKGSAGVRSVAAVRGFAARFEVQDLQPLALVGGFAAKISPANLSRVLSDPAVAYVQQESQRKLVLHDAPAIGGNRAFAAHVFAGIDPTPLLPSFHTGPALHRDPRTVPGSDGYQISGHTGMSIRADLAALRSGPLVAGIVQSARHQFQMFDVHTQARAAGVVDVRAGGRFSMREDVRRAMRANLAAASHVASPIAVPVLTSSPEDAAVLLGWSYASGEAFRSGRESVAQAAIPRNQARSEGSGVGVMGHVASLSPLASVSWGLDRIDAREGLDGRFSPALTGAGVHVYINDTGISPTADLGPRLSSECFSTIVFRGCLDGHGHGTHVAGTAAGTTWGVAKKATVHSVRFLDENGSGTDSDAIRTMEWIQAHNPGPGARKVVNASWGGGPAPALEAAICRVIESGVVFVAAAGNESTDARNSTPARIVQVVTVGAMDRNDKFAYFSNYGPGTDIAAPGVDIESDAPTGGTAVYSGTSMATPHVVGAAALYLEIHPGAKPAEVEAGLIANATLDKLGGLPTETANRLLYVGSEFK